MARPRELEIVLDAEQLQRVRAVAIGEVGLQSRAGSKSGASCHDTADGEEASPARPSSSAGVGDRPSADPRAHHHAGFGRPPQPDNGGVGGSPPQLAQPRRVLAAVSNAVHRGLRERLGDRDGERRILEPDDRDLVSQTLPASGRRAATAPVRGIPARMPEAIRRSGSSTFILNGCCDPNRQQNACCTK